MFLVVFRKYHEHHDCYCYNFLVISPLPWYALLIIVGRGLRWHIQDTERAGVCLLWILFAGYILEMEILIFAICRSLHSSTGEMIFCLTVGALTIMGFHMMVSVSAADHVFDKTDLYDSLRSFPSEISSR